MRHLTYVEPGTVRWEDAPDPTLPGPGGALVRPLAAARCDLDIAMAAFGLFPGPFALGHECVAEVVDVGPEVTAHRPGDRVVVPFQVSCGACDACASGRTAGCRTFKAKAGAAFGFGSAGGGHGGVVADLLAVPAADHLLLAAPADLAPELLCTLPDNVVDAWRTVYEPLQRWPGADVTVIGGLAASIGLYIVLIAKALGAGTVTYVDSSAGDGAERLQAAEGFGADVVEHQGAWPKAFGRSLVTVDNTGDPEGLACVLRSTDDYGICTPVAIYFTPTVPLPMLNMYTRGVDLRVQRCDARRELPHILPLVASGAIDPLRVPTTVASWDQADELWLQPATKLVLTHGA